MPGRVVAAWILRKTMLKMAIRLRAARCSIASRSMGIEHARAAQPHAVIAANHASFLDGLLLGAFLPGDAGLRDRHVHRAEMVGEAVPVPRQRDAGRSDQSAVDARA